MWSQWYVELVGISGVQWVCGVSGYEEIVGMTSQWV